MVEVTNIKVSGLVESVLASGYAMMVEPYAKPLNEYTEDSEEFKKGINRMKMLVRSSKKTDVHCHDNALVGINVAFDVKYPQYWTPEFQRYHFADIVTSSSKMHKLLKMEIRKSTTKYVSPQSIKEAQYHVNRYNEILADESIVTYGYWNTEEDANKWVIVEGREEVLYTAFMVMLNNIPLGLELFMRVTTNYKQLQTIWYQRRHHKLIEDWQEGFCKNFIEKLPYAKELIFGENGN